MRSNCQRNLKLIILISFMVMGIFSDDSPVAANSDGSCPVGRTIADVGTLGSTSKKCVLNTKLVYDCLFYSDNAACTCTCDSILVASKLAIKLDSRMGCVPQLK
jgi:hypothetical protein